MGWIKVSLFVFTAFRADAEDFHHVRDFSVAFFASEALRSVCNAEVQGFDFVTTTADEVMMVMIVARVKFVAGSAVAKFATANKTSFLHGGDAAIDRNHIALALGEAAVDFVDGKRAVFADEHAEDGTAGFGHAQTILAEAIESGVELGSGHGREKYAGAG